MTNGGFFLTSVKDPGMAVLAAEDIEFSSSEDYLENDIHSPTDTSEDSVEVKVSAISLGKKRKHLEPAKPSEGFTGPLKKRMCLKIKAEINEAHPFRPWSPSPAVHIKNEDLTINHEEILPSSKEFASSGVKVEETFSVPSPSSMCQTKTEPQFTYFRPPSPIRFYQNEPVSLVKKRESESEQKQEVRVPIHPQIQSLSTAETERMILKTNEIFPSLHNSTTSNVNKKSLDSNQRREQRNYKNMTRERRIEANARERTRVHTISAAFDTLRRSIPSYSHNQKLSKLSVLRIACSYIMTLSSIVNEDSDNEEPSTAECVEMVSKTIQREGKLRKKKDDND